MKKIAMLTVKRLVGLIPTPLKRALKKNAKLTELYSTGIRKSGLFYGVPSKKTQAKQYDRFLQRQKKQLAEFESELQRTLFCNIVVVGAKDSELTLASLEQASVSSEQRIIVGNELQQKSSSAVYVRTLAEAILQLNAGFPTLFVKGGDTFESAFGALYAAALGNAELVYCDTDTSGRDGRFAEPKFLPDWNPELQLSTAYINTGILIASSVLHKLSDEPLNSIADIAAAVALNYPCTNVGHITHTVLHTFGNSEADPSPVQSVRHYLQARLQTGQVSSEVTSVNRVLWSTEPNPLVSLIIPTKDGHELVRACIESILSKSQYDNFEILLIDNGSTEAESLAYFNELKSHAKVRVLEYPGPFNYSAINNFGAEHAQGEVIGLINNDIEVISQDWLDYMVGHALRENIGCVGAKLLYSDERIQHAGVVLGYGGGAGHAHKYFPRFHPGYQNRLVATQNYSAVTAACLLVKKSLFDEVGGLNEKDLAVAFNDVDFCLRVRELGKRNVYCAEAELYHHESVSRGLDIAPEKAARFNRELTYLQTQWADIIARDPAYSPNLTLKRENFAMKEEREYIGTNSD